MPAKVALSSLAPRQLVTLLLLASAALSISGFVLEYGFNALPCRMCWWQRYVHYIIAALALLGFISGRYKWAAVGTFLASGTGLFIAVWQMGGQYKWWQLPEFCVGNKSVNTTLTDLSHAFSNLPPRCDEVNFTILNFSLAEWNIPAMLFTLALSFMILKRKNV